MRFAVSIVLLVLAVPAVALAGDLGTFEVRTERGEPLTFRVLECGRILGDEGVEYVRDYDAQGNKIFSHTSGTQEVIRQTKIPLEAGTYFGCTVHVPRVPVSDRLIIDHVAVIPSGAKVPSGEQREFVYSHEYTAKKVSNPRFWWHSFKDTPSKALEGDWRFEIRHNGQTLLAEKIFLSRPGP